MKEKICCFCGHREILAAGYLENIKNAINYLIEREYGGAFQTMKYAEKFGVKIMRYDKLT